MENKDIDKAARGKCTLPDIELIEKSRAIIRDVSATYGKAWKMTIPPMPNHDSDFILSELVERFISRQSEIDELIEALEELRWIPVSERLPFYDKAPDRPETIPCLIKTTSRMLMVAYYDVKYECWNDDQDDDILGYEVAFWRPIDTPKATQLLKRYENERDNKG